MDLEKSLWEKQKARDEREEYFNGLLKRDYEMAARGAARDAIIHYYERRNELAGQLPPPATPRSSPFPELMNKAEELARFCRATFTDSDAYKQFIGSAYEIARSAAPDARERLEELKQSAIALVRREMSAVARPSSSSTRQSPPPISLVERRSQIETQIRATVTPLSAKMLLHALQQVDLAAPGAAAELDFIASKIAPAR